MSLESNTGLNVKANDGPRDTGRAAGVVKTEGSKQQLTIELTGAQVDDELYVENFVIPQYSIILACYLEVTEAFVLDGNADNTLEVGTATSEATNGFSITSAECESLGSTSLTGALSGTWDAEAALAADTIVNVVVAGTTPSADATVGKGRIVIEYMKAA